MNKLALASILALAALVLSSGSAAAHVTKTFGDYSVKIGWDQEPSESGVYNHITMQVWRGDNESDVVSGVNDTLKLTIKSLGQSKDLDVEESDDTPGSYSAPIEPTQPGIYVVHAEGTINGTAVSADFNIEDVNNVQEIQFPTVTQTTQTTATTVISQPTGTTPHTPGIPGLGLAAIVGGIVGAAMVLAVRRRR
jgi:hypothetical protein